MAAETLLPLVEALEKKAMHADDIASEEENGSGYWMMWRAEAKAYRSAAHMVRLFREEREQGQQGATPTGSGCSAEPASDAAALTGEHPSRDAVKPSPGLLMSMAIRYNHSLGMPGRYDWRSGMPSLGKREPGGHAKRLASTLVTMRQVWEEVAGSGFYSPEREEQYAAIIARCGVTFTESGYPIATRHFASLPASEQETTR